MESILFSHKQSCVSHMSMLYQWTASHSWQWTESEQHLGVGMNQSPGTALGEHCQALAQAERPGSSPAHQTCPTNHTHHLCVCTKRCPSFPASPFRAWNLIFCSLPIFHPPISMSNYCKNGIKSFERRLGMSSPPSQPCSVHIPL